MQHSDDIHLERQEREEARWLILRTLYLARPTGSTETIILGGLKRSGLGVNNKNVRNELDYLVDKGLVTFVNRKGTNWFAKISAYGVDVVEFTKDAPLGIARPDEG